MSYSLTSALATSAESFTFIDQARRAPELLRAITLPVGRDRHPGRFLLTGSVHVLALPNLSDSPAWRKRIITLWPLSQAEIAGAEGRFTEMMLTRDPLFPHTGEVGRRLIKSPELTPARPRPRWVSECGRCPLRRLKHHALSRLLS